MAVYVNPIRPTIASRKWPYNQGCHMWADTISELHAMARKIGLRRSWFQNRKDCPHYDLTRYKRSVAISKGTIARTHKHLVKYMKYTRARNYLFFSC